MQRLQQKLVQKQILAPRQILLAKLLQLNIVNLEQKILNELETNPVLEEIQREDDTPISSDDSDGDTMDISFDADEPEPRSLLQYSPDNKDIPQQYQLDFIEKLVEQLDICGLSAFEHVIAEEILWNLDDRGYFTVELSLIADRLNTNEENVEKILKFVQHLEPLGIASRDLRECLLIQLEDKKDSLAYRIISEYLDDFSNKRYESLQRKLGCTEDELAEAKEVITHLNPRPGEGKIASKEEIVIPDLIVRERDGEWSIQTYDSGLPELRISPDYIGLLEEGAHISTDARKYLKEQSDSANWFIEAIKQRRNTLIRVMKAIIDKQPQFFSGDTKDLNPMKLQDIANEIEMDISTISRSTRGKYVDTSFGIFELKSFFTESAKKQSGEIISTNLIKQVLKDIIENENKKKPYNDEKLAEKLQAVGYDIARRTVAKYREQLNYPVARLRRELK
ncbi:RNA polymerase factor sigma-54 [bacterium]|nr:RNA polymerase factor sigma-54 [bacterium]